MEDSENLRELKDLVLETLSATGNLSKIKAEIRAAVYVALANDAKDRVAPETTSILSSTTGGKALALVAEFLQYINLEYTEKVLLSEIDKAKIPQLEREELYKMLKITKQTKRPVLLDLIDNCSPAEGKNGQKVTVESLDVGKGETGIAKKDGERDRTGKSFPEKNSDSTIPPLVRKDEDEAAANYSDDYESIDEDIHTEVEEVPTSDIDLVTSDRTASPLSHRDFDYVEDVQLY
eukprot:Nk52_evm64s215 gene=Nk52_evmTU64s215